MNNLVCIVDDNAEILEIFATFFYGMGYDVLKASGGQECLDAIRAQPPDVILLDIMMEPMDGWKTLELIKVNPTTKDIPVIMVSGKRPDIEEMNKYRNLYVRYIMKPVNFSKLHEAVMTVIETHSGIKT